MKLIATKFPSITGATSIQDGVIIDLDIFCECTPSEGVLNMFISGSDKVEG